MSNYDINVNSADTNVSNIYTTLNDAYPNQNYANTTLSGDGIASITPDSAKASDFYNFNTAAPSSSYNIIPNNTLAKVAMHIKRGGYSDPSKGWVGGYATISRVTGAVYLACEFTITEGEYKGRKIWSNIGLYSHKNNNKWGEMGRSFIRSILNSATGYSDKDQSERAKAARGIKSFEELNGLEFIAKISVVKDQNDSDKEQNVIKCAIDPEHKDYIKIMGIPGLSNISKPDWA